MKTLLIKDTREKKTSELMSALKKKFKVWSYWNDEQLDKNFPVPEKPTARSFKLESEANDMKGSSRNEIHAKYGKEMMTLREYILFFEAYHKETGNYPDKEGWTIFQDRLPDGFVALGFWYPYDSKVRFFWCNPVLEDPRGGGRVAISLNPSEALVPFEAEDLEARVERIEKWIRKEANFINPFD